MIGLVLALILLALAVAHASVAQRDESRTLLDRRNRKEEDPE